MVHFPFLLPREHLLLSCWLLVSMHSLPFLLMLQPIENRQKLHWAKETRRKVAQVGGLVGRAVAWK